MIHRYEVNLPRGKARLYNKITEAYLENIDKARDPDGKLGLAPLPWSLEEKKRWLARVGFMMQLRRTETKEEDEEEETEVITFLAFAFSTTTIFS